jgi:hypothetical protein
MMVGRALASSKCALHSVRQLGRLRPLLECEAQFLAREFGDSLALSQLRIAGGGHPFGRLAWQPRAHWIQLHDSVFEAADSARPIRSEYWPVLAHEALYVWQRVHRHHRISVSVDGLWLGVVAGRAAYRYSVGDDPSEVLRAFLDGNIEQQGQMFEDYVRSNVFRHEARDAKFEHMARYIRERAWPKTA